MTDSGPSGEVVWPAAQENRIAGHSAAVAGEHHPGYAAVAVRSDEVPGPVTARPARSPAPFLDLWTGSGLPAGPFRTDDRPVRQWHHPGRCDMSADCRPSQEARPIGLRASGRALLSAAGPAMKPWHGRRAGPPMRIPAALLWAAAAAALAAAGGSAAQERSMEAPPVVARHTAVFTGPPRNVPTNMMPDGALLGNGDVIVALAVEARPAPAGQAAPSLPPRQAGASPVKVFILAGQSNMEGQGAVRGLDKDGNDLPGTLKYLPNDPAKAATFRHLWDAERPAPAPEEIGIEATNDSFGDPSPGKVKKLQVAYRLEGRRQERTVGGRSSAPSQAALTAGEGETLTIAAKLGEAVIEKAVYGDLPDGATSDVTDRVRKIAESGQSPERWTVRDDVWVRFNDRRGGLTIGFGANRNLFGPELQFGHVMGNHFKEQVLIIKTAWGGHSLYGNFRPPSSGGEVGPSYKAMLETVNQVLSSLKTEFPGYDGRGYELSGFVWWHGWNDGCDPKNAVPEYERNLVNLIKDLRRDLKAPGLPVVIGELTGPWVEVGGEWAELRKAQAAAADPSRHPEFKGNVLFVETHDFVRKESESPGGWACHEFNNAETYFLVGNACGEAMRRLVSGGGR